MQGSGVHIPQLEVQTSRCFGVKIDGKAILDLKHYKFGVKSVFGEPEYSWAKTIVKYMSFSRLL